MGKKPIIGLLGGGQLGRMLCEAAGPLGIEIAVLDEENCPAKQINTSSLHVTGSFKDPAKIRELASRCDVLTVEIEHVETEVLEDIEKNGVTVQSQEGKSEVKKVAIHPSWRTIRLIQDKYLQKEHLREHGLPIADQVAIDSGDGILPSLKDAATRLGFPFMLKARKGSYDGRGNFKVSSEQDFKPAIDALGKLPLYAERWAHFKKELAVMVVRTEHDDGNWESCTAYPAVETVHEDSICSKVFMPPRHVPNTISEEARRIASSVIKTLWGRGVFAVEMFVLEDDSIMVNEVAPRPHNSGHYTIEAVPYMSQYKALLYSILGLPIPTQLSPRTACAIMLNILGGAKPTSHDRLVETAEKTSQHHLDVYLHLYGKSSKPGRKIGHITTTGSASLEKLESVTAPLTKIVDEIRLERIKASSEQMRPDAAPQQPKSSQPSPLVLVTMGSDSDLPKLKAGLDVLEEFQVPYTLNITSAHRTPEYMMRVAKEAAGRGIKVMIAAAGGAAHLPGMLSSETPLPVIGVPIAATHLDGYDSLLSIVQMPRGVPTATIGINNSTNAALLAVRILGSFIPQYQERMLKYQNDMRTTVLEKDEQLRELGYAKYIAKMGTK